MARAVITRPHEGGILPDVLIAFFRRRLMEGAGMALLACAALLLAAIASYAPGDPSLNSATDATARNLLGGPGAHAADFLIQMFGITAALPVVTLAAWGWRVIRGRAVTRPVIRLLALMLAMVLLGTAASALPLFDAWPLTASLGGALGGLLLERTAAVLGARVPALEAWMIAACAALLGLPALIAALGLSWSEWRASGGLVARTAGFVWRAPARIHDILSRRAGHAERIDPALDDDGAPAPRTRRRTPARDGLVAAKAPRAKTGRRAQARRQGRLRLGPDDAYQSPPLDLLEAPSPASAGKIITQEALSRNAHMLASVLEDFGIRGDIVKVRPGPVVTLYELEPAPGTKTSRVIGLSEDIARSMSAVSVRVAVVPGRNVIGIELPNTRREMVSLRELLASDTFERASGKLTLALGKDIGGTPVLVDLARMPHLLIAGTTGSGKSVAINTMVLSLLYQLPPDACRFIMIDPKMLELSVYEGIPHLLTPVVTEPGKAVVALKWAVREMEERYRAMSRLGVRNIASYNTRLAEARRKGETLMRRVQTGFDDDGAPVLEEQPLSMESLPLIVVVVDEMADLMLVAGKDIEASVQRLSQMARAAGIHLIMATQRPSVDVITGTIKANFPTRISFQVTSKIDSRTILGEQGGEQLLGQGDMLYMAGGGRVSRVHGPFVSDEEVESVVEYLKSQGDPVYLDEVTEEADDDSLFNAGGAAGGGSGDTLYDEAVALIAREGKASTSFIQRHLQIGYNRAARIIERMETEGVVSKANRVGRREVLIGGGDGQNF